jgi:hypothetical protein
MVRTTVKKRRENTNIGTTDLKKRKQDGSSDTTQRIHHHGISNVFKEFDQHGGQILSKDVGSRAE